MCWLLCVVETLEDELIPHVFNSAFLLPYALFRGLFIARHQVPLLISLVVLHFLIVSIQRVHLDISLWSV